MLKQAEKFKEEDKMRRELVDLKNEAHGVYETTKRQLEVQKQNSFWRLLMFELV